MESEQKQRGAREHDHHHECEKQHRRERTESLTVGDACNDRHGAEYMAATVIVRRIASPPGRRSAAGLAVRRIADRVLMTFNALLHLRQRLKRRRRRIVAFIAVAIALTALTWGVLVEGTLLRFAVASIIGWRLEARCTIDAFHWNGWNRAVIRGLSLRVDGWPDGASEVIRIGEMNADFDPLPLLWGSLALTDIRVDRMTLPLILDSETGRLNLLSLRLPSAGPSSRRPPRIHIQDLEMQVGKLDHSTGTIRYEGRHELVGSVSSDAATRGLWTLQLEQKPARPGDPPATIIGTLQGDSFDYSVTLSNLLLDESLRTLLPEVVRQIWPHMDLEGRIDTITLSGNREQPVSTARIAVSNITMTLPATGMEDIWARYANEQVLTDAGPPRIKVTRGELEFRDWVLVMRELRGELTASAGSEPVVPLPVSLSFWIDLERGRLRDWNIEHATEWVTEALEHAPFALHLEVLNYAFEPQEGATSALELPRLAAEILRNFKVKRGRVSISAFVTREDPVWRGGTSPGADPPLEPPIAADVRVQGSLFIDGGVGGYFKFPYMLKDVRAQIAFENDLVRVESLRGKGSEGSEILISGTVVDPGDDAGVDLRIITPRAPIDQVLIDALVESPAQRFLTLLFCAPAFASLQHAGLPEREVESMRTQRADLVQRIRPGAPEPLSKERIAQCSSRIAQLGAVDWLSKFRPGGWCALDLRVRRDVGGGDMVETTGTITLHEAEALCEPLPYPIRVLGRDAVGVARATITVEDQRIVLPEEGLAIQLPGGGTGRIQGSIELPRDATGERVVTPAIRVTTENDAINQLLLAAIPVDEPNGQLQGPSDGWPGVRRSEAATMLDRIGLTGNLASTIDIGGDGRGAITWRVRLDLSDGVASPLESVGTDVAESGLEWPQGFSLEDCRAVVTVDERKVSLVGFVGTRGAGRIHADGTLDFATGARSLEVDFRDISPGEYMVNLLPDHARQTGHDFWRSHEPAGLFDATLHWTRAADGRERRELRMRPGWIEFTSLPPPAVGTLPRRRVRVERVDGELVIVDTVAHARALELRIAEEGFAPSTLRLDGALSLSRSDRASEVTARWNGAELSSTLLLEGLHLAGADAAIDRWNAWRPAGRFDALLVRRVEEGREPVIGAELRFGDIAAVIDGAATSIRVLPASAPVVVEPRVIRLNGLLAETPNGRFELRGTVPLHPHAASEASLRVRFEGARFGEPELALLGEGTRHAMQAIELDCPGPVRVDDGEILFGAEGDALVFGFRGPVSLEQASFVAGTAFTEMDALLDLDIPISGGADIRIRSPRFRVLGYPVRDAQARVVVTPSASRVTVSPLTGTVAGGLASAEAIVRIVPESDDGGDFEVTALLVGGQLADLPSRRDDPGSGASQPIAVAEGRVDASFAIGGPLNKPQRRTGRGLVEIRDGRMAELPITMGLLQVSQLMLPLNTALDTGDIRFHIDGDHLVFERFDLTCPTLQFRGTGEMNLRDDALSLRFNYRGTLPIWSDFFAAVSETLFAIDVRGTLSDPAVTVAPLPPFNRPPVRAPESAP